MGREKVAFVTHGFNAERFGSVIQQLLAQAGDGHVHAAVQAIVADAAQVFQQRVPIHNLPGMGCQLPQQVEIGRRQRHLLAGKQHLAIDRIDGECAKTQRLVRGELRGRGVAGCSNVLAQMQAHACQEYSRRGGFEDVVVCPHLQGQYVVHVAVEGSKQHNRPVPAGAQIPAQGHAIFTG